MVFIGLFLTLIELATYTVLHIVTQVLFLTENNANTGDPPFRDFRIRDPLYFMILFQWKLAKKVDFRKLL